MPIVTYRVSSADYYRHGEACNDSIAGKVNIALCEMPISQLVARYCLSGRKILSLGSGRAFEEFWMARAGCVLTLVDLDVDPAARLEDHLQSLLPSASESDELNYVIGDALEYCYGVQAGSFDALYVSSMHPDEIRREMIQQAFILDRTEAARKSYLTWPKGTKPYSEYVTAGWPLIADGGLAIMQHYRGGVDVVMQPHYFDDMQDQMSEFGLTLLEAWCFRRSPQHLLVIAVKGGQEEVQRWQTHLANRQSISTFHGRYPDASIKTDVINIFPRPVKVKPRHFKTRMLDSFSRGLHSLKESLI